MAERPTKTTRKTTRAKTIPVAKVPGSATSTRVTSQSQRSAMRAGTVTEDQIRERAYQIFLARNGAPGDPVRDWCEAERELRGEIRS